MLLPLSYLSPAMISHAFVKVDTQFSGRDYLNNLDDIPWTNDFRIKLHVGFVGGEGHRGVSDAICPRELGLYVVDTGSACHPYDLQDKRTKIPGLRAAFPMYLRDLSDRHLLLPVSSPDTGLPLLNPCARFHPYQCPGDFCGFLPAPEYATAITQPVAEDRGLSSGSLRTNELLENTPHCIFSPATLQQSLHIKYT